MSSKEVKAGLKSAREAIKNKEFKEALKHCKAVLKLEKNNYNAWVFIGVAATELQQPDQAQTAYRKATELEPEQLLAWQGLANLYEKSDQADFKAELPKIYQKLITLYEISDKAKYFEVSKKLVEVYQLEKNYLQVARVWRRLIQVREREHLILAFERALQMMVDVPSEVHKSLSQDYIKCLSKLPHEVAKLKEVCDATLSRYPTHPYPLEALSENYIRTGQFCYRLSELDPNNSQAHFGLGIKACQDKKYEDAIKSISLDAKNDPVLLALKGRAHLQKGQTEEVSAELLSSHPGSVEGLTLKGLAHVAKEQHKQAEESFLEALSRSPDNGELFFLLGRLYWSMGDEMRRDRNKAHTHLLKAAKLDPYLGSVFRFLGHYYKEVAKDQGRARGCYKRAFELDSSDAEAGAATVDLSMEQGDMDSALTVLQSVTERATPGSAKWAWMRRGLYHLKTGQHQQAIADLQAALRADPLDWVCWECLGEAYLNRRSFIAALKAFDKAHALQPTSIYSLYQTAAIKQILGRFKEAAAEYRQISEQEDYVPALKGLGECLLALARNALDDYLDGRAVDLIQNAIHYLFRAVKQRPDLSCLWKLLGDACTTSRTVSPNRAKVLVPGALCGMDPPDQSHTLDQRQNILNYRTEGVKGYAYWVCSTLLDKSNRDSELYLYNIVQMNAISAAQVALSKYTERIQTDPDAFIMLGYLNTHLQLKKQATEAYRRAVELLQASPHTDQLSFALRGYGRALSDDGQWEEAVRVYSSTPLEELHDLIGLALACFRIGRLPESYEKALVVASSEKEKACILTALALIQHRLGSMDHAKTLLFKCSMLKEPVPESLQCLCALGLVHGDVTLASATLTELLKLGEPIGGAVEERCLLTCTLLALQGNFSGVHREAARAIHRYCIIFRDTVSLNFIQCDKATRTYHFYFCVNLEFNSFHLRRNALKTIQRAVLLCPGKLSYNQTCYVRYVYDLFSVKSLQAEDGLLAQALEGWVLQQAVTGLKQSSQYDQAETLCSQVLSVSPEHPVVFLMLRQVQCERLLLSEASNCVPPAVLDQLSAAVMANHTSVSAWHWLAEVYRSQGLLAQASVAYRKSLQLASQLGDHFGKMSSLLRLALLALMPCLFWQSQLPWKDLVLEASAEVLKMGSSPVALLYQALLQFSIKMGARETRRLLEKIVYASASGSSETIASVARWYLLRHLHTKDDLELIDTLLVKATAEGDSRLVDFHRRLYPSS
uniref:SKI3 subunit of superkiller complex n=1 Tax=Sinocyclocheilus grahami TaxID=75366 RepID=A0A672MCS8_SINGR